VDTGVHVMLALRYAAGVGAANTVRFAVLVHDLGKARTPRELWPSHHGHEEAGVAPIEALCERLKVPASHRELALLAARHHTLVHRALELKSSTVLTLLENCDAFRRPARFAELLEACEADARGRTGKEREPYPQAPYLQRACDAAAAVTMSEEERQGLSGPAIGDAMRKRRLAAVDVVKASASTLQPG
jgi:tRNA nucleotidyltransferase (CCA-adding enzyme)